MVDKLKDADISAWKKAQKQAVNILNECPRINASYKLPQNFATS